MSMASDASAGSVPVTLVSSFDEGDGAASAWACAADGDETESSAMVRRCDCSDV